MTDAEIAAHQRGVLTPEQIAAHPELPTLLALRADPLYPQLCAAFVAGEGNLLELTEDDTALQQIATIRWAVETYGPSAPSVGPTGAIVGPTVDVAEVGFHKGFFLLLLNRIRPTQYINHYAVDIRSESTKAADILNTRHGLNVSFTAGNSWLVWESVLERIGGPADIAWIDGGHDAETLANDLGLAMHYGAKLIMVDDADWLPALGGVIQDCANVYGYQRVTPPTSQDRRGIAVLVRP